MTIKQEWFFDKAFVLDAINSCLNTCKKQMNYGFDDSDLFKNAFKLGLIRIRDYGHASGLLPHDLQDLEDQFYELNYQFQLKVHGLNDEVKQVSEPAPSTQVQLFRLLGKETKFQSLYALNEQAPSPASIPEHCFWPLFSIGWRPSLTLTKRLFSTTRPVGGLA